MKIYNKLIRDKIPEIMDSENKKYKIKELSDSDYKKLLLLKLDEEVSEFKQDLNIEELADILEVIDGLSQVLGEDFNKVLSVKKEKLNKRGGFKRKLLLEYVE